MKLHLIETCRGVTAELVLQIDAQDPAFLREAVQSSSIALLGDQLTEEEALDRAHPELLRLLREARLSVEKSLNVAMAELLEAEYEERRARKTE